MVVDVSAGVTNGFPVYKRFERAELEYHLNIYPLLDPPDAVAVSVALELLPIVVPGATTVGSGFTVMLTD